MLTAHRLEYFILITFGKVFSLLDFTRIHTFSKIIAYFAFHVLRIRRDVVISNLQKAFPELSNSQIQNLAKKNYQSIASTFIEVFKLNSLSEKEIKDLITFEGQDLINDKYQENKGLILLTAHFGNWELGAIGMGIYYKGILKVLVKKQKNTYVADWLKELRERFGNKEVTLGPSVREIYKSIKEKNIVGIVGDQRGKRDGVRVKFFGRDTSTFPGTAAIALKSQSPVVVILCTRQNNGRYISIVEEIKYQQFSGSDQSKIQQFNQQYMNILENAIRKYPEQWFWMHNIWKY